MGNPFFIKKPFFRVYHKHRKKTILGIKEILIYLHKLLIQFYSK